MLRTHRLVEEDESFEVAELEGIRRVDEGMRFLVNGTAGSEDLYVEVGRRLVGAGAKSGAAGGGADVLGSTPVGGIEGLIVPETAGLRVGDVDDVAIVEEVLVNLSANRIGKQEEARGSAGCWGEGCGRKVEFARVGKLRRPSGIAAAEFLFFGGVDFFLDAPNARLQAEHGQPDWSQGNSDAYDKPVRNGAGAASHGW